MTYVYMYVCLKGNSICQLLLVVPFNPRKELQYGLKRIDRITVRNRSYRDCELQNAAPSIWSIGLVCREAVTWAYVSSNCVRGFFKNVFKKKADNFSRKKGGGGGKWHVQHFPATSLFKRWNIENESKQIQFCVRILPEDFLVPTHKRGLYGT